MAKKLSFSIAINLLTENFKKGANQVQSMFGKLKGSVLGFAAVLGVGGASLRGFIETTSGFEAAVSKLSAILGTTPGQIKALTDSAKKLGETTKYTAAEATNLQTELAKLGFTKDEILSATESVLKFAQATDAELAEAAALAGAALRMFGAEASESKKYVSAMSIATTKSALSFAYLRDALPTVGPVAKAFNFTIEDTLALLGKLADSGFDASSAATATRNILLNLADGGGKLATALGGPVKTLPELVSGLQKLKAEGVDLNTTLELTDKRSVAAFNSFLQSADKISPLRDAITGVEDDLDQMAATMGDNVKGAMAGLASAWEAILIKMSENTSAPFKNLIKWITDLLRDIKSGFSGVVAFVITLISGKMLQSIVAFFAKHWILIGTEINKAKIAEEQKLLATQKKIEAQKALEAEQTAFESIENGKRLGNKQKVKKAEIALAKATAAEKRAILTAETAATRAAALESTTVWGKMGKTVTLAFANIFRSIKMLFSTMWVTALITAIGYVIGKLVNMYTEAKRIKGIFSEYKKGLELSVNTGEISKLQKLLDIMNDRKRKQDEINAAQAELQRILGIEKVSQDELNKLVQKRIELLKETARSEYAANEIAAAESKNRALARGVGMTDKQMERLSQLYVGKNTSKQNREYYYQAVGKEYRKNGVKGRYDTGALDKAVNEYTQNTKIIADATNLMAKAQASAATIINTLTPTPPPVEPSEELQKQQEKYAQSLRELNARREVEKMTVDEYNKGYAELNKKFLIDAMSSDDKSIVNSEYARNLAVEYRKAMQSIITSTSSEILNNIQKEIESEDIRPEATPMLGKRDTTFDYKKTETDWLSEELNIWTEYKKNLQNAVNDGATYMQDTLNNAMSNVSSLGEALKIAQVKQDIKEFSKELNDGLYSGVKDIASSSDRMVSAFENLRDVLNDVDASGWEQIMAVWNAMTNTIDGLMSIIKTIETLTELTNKLAAAKKVEAGIDKVTANEKVVNAAKGAAATIAETQVEKSAATTEVAANTAKGASAAGASAAKLPFPWNIVAIGGAIAAAIAAFAVIPKFASGGIITGGPSSGDKILARVNAGEMILNGRQQSNLFEAINSGKLGSTQNQSVNISFDRVRGSDIFLSLKNYMKSTGKKL